MKGQADRRRRSLDRHGAAAQGASRPGGLHQEGDRSTGRTDRRPRTRCVPVSGTHISSHAVAQKPPQPGQALPAVRDRSRATATSVQARRSASSRTGGGNVSLPRERSAPGGVSSPDRLVSHGVRDPVSADAARRTPSWGCGESAGSSGQRKGPTPTSSAAPRGLVVSRVFWDTNLFVYLVEGARRPCRIRRCPAAADARAWRRIADVRRSRSVSCSSSRSR